MGFSVSGATVILFLGIVISFGIAYSAANNGFERVHQAYEENAEDDLTRQNTAVNITSTNVANEGGQLYLETDVTNNGTTTLSVKDTDVLVDGTYKVHSNMETLTVDGNSNTDLWLPGETLHFKVAVSSTDPLVKVVTGPGVAASEEVA